MQHTGTICTHCSNGCKTTLSVRNDRIVRANNRDRSGINNDFLCVKGRFGFDFQDHPERLQAPLMRSGGVLEPVSWARALVAVAAKFREVNERGGKFGIIGSNHTTNEENYYLQKFAREGLGTSHIDHHRTGDLPAIVGALSGRENALATIAGLYHTKAALVIGADLAQQQPLVAWQFRQNWRHHGMRMYAVTPGPVREDKYAISKLRVKPGEEFLAIESLRDSLVKEPELTIVFGDTIKGDRVRELVAFGDSLGIPVKYVCLVDYSNSHGAAAMGLLPHLGPGYKPLGQEGMNLEEMLAAEDLDVLWVVGANPLKNTQLRARAPFVVVQELFLTETAQRADVVLPAACAYEKAGTVTNVTGEVQRLAPALRAMGAKPDLEIFGLLAKELKLQLGPAKPDHVFEEIRRTVKGYNVPLPVLATGGAAQTYTLNGAVPPESRPGAVRSAGDTLFTSGSLGRFSKHLTSVIEYPGELYGELPS
jgi:NADH-quinone oxidoreductase subunit G